MFRESNSQVSFSFTHITVATRTSTFVDNIGVQGVRNFIFIQEIRYLLSDINYYKFNGLCKVPLYFL